MKARVAVISVVVLLTLSVFAVGYSALGEAEDVTASSNAKEESRNGDENAAVTAFRFVCPFH